MPIRSRSSGQRRWKRSLRKSSGVAVGWRKLSPAARSRWLENKCTYLRDTTLAPKLDPPRWNRFHLRFRMSPDKQTLDDLRIDRAAPSRGRPKTALIVVALVLIALALGF